MGNVALSTPCGFARRAPPVAALYVNYTDWRRTLLERQRWMMFLLPFLVFMLVGPLEPTPDQPGGNAIGLSIPYASYPWLYAVKIALTRGRGGVRAGPAIASFRCG